MSLVLQSSGGGQITIQEPATASNFTQTLPAATGEVMVSGNMPAFSAYRTGSAQSYSGGVYTKINFNAEQFDTANCYDSTTNYRFTPNVAGYYQFNASCDVGAPDNRTTAYLYKNGSAFIAGPNMIGNGTNAQAISLNCIAYANGSTDYFELYIQGNNASNIDATGNPFVSYFQAVLVRSA
jgi:hypothetical protein